MTKGEYVLTIEPRFAEKEINLTRMQADKIVAMLTSLTREGIFDNWTTRSPRTSVIIRGTLHHPASRFYLSTNSTVHLNGADQKFIHSARLKATQLAADYPNLNYSHLPLDSPEVVCKECPTNAPKTLGHVMSCCESKLQLYPARHNSAARSASGRMETWPEESLRPCRGCPSTRTPIQPETGHCATRASLGKTIPRDNNN